MKLITWNVNGIRAAERKGFLRWFEREQADVVCVQETKAHPDQLDLFLRTPGGANAYWHSAQKPGYSGVAVFSRKEPVSVTEGLGVAEIDSEGRVLELDYGGFVLLNAYFPNSQREHTRLPYKIAFCEAMARRTEALRASGKHVVLCGDLNIAHREIDLENPRQNRDNAGFLPEERAWLDSYERLGYVDAFRKFEKSGGHYTWWSNRPGVRERNIGWRLDYFWVNREFEDRLLRTRHQPDVPGSDHCPVVLEIKD